MSKKRRRYHLIAECTISLVADVWASSKKEALELAGELQPTAIHESSHEPDLSDGDWHTTGELDGTPKKIRVERVSDEDMPEEAQDDDDDD